MRTEAELLLRYGGEDAPAPNPEVETQKAFEARPENRIVVARRLATPHPLVERTRLAMALAKPGPDGCLGPRGNNLNVRVTPKLLPRALRLMDALVKALETRGHRVGTEAPDRPQSSASVEVQGERISILLDERVTRTRHVLTQAEHRHPYRAPRWDYAPTGTLRIKIDEWTRAHLRKRWADSKKRPLEDALNDVVLGLVLVADAKRAQRLQAERDERERQEVQRQRIEAEQRRREDLQRRDLLERQVESWTKAGQVRAFVDEAERRAQVKNTSTEPGTELGDWITWARQHADRLDPLVPPIRADGTPPVGPVE